MKSFFFCVSLWNVSVISCSFWKAPCSGKTEKPKDAASRTHAAGLGSRQPPLAAPSINLSVMRWAPRLHPQGQHTIWRSFWGFGQSSTVDWAAPLVCCYPDGLLPVKKINSSCSRLIKPFFFPKTQTIRWHCAEVQWVHCWAGLLLHTAYCVNEETRSSNMC